jgi:hypothetical protein
VAVHVAPVPVQVMVSMTWLAPCQKRTAVRSPAVVCGGAEVHPAQS